MTKNEILNFLKEHKSELHEKYGVTSIGLFGSYAKGNNNSESDIDIVVQTTNADLFSLVHLKDYLQEVFQKQVDIIRLREKMNKYLKARINEESIYV
jgi:hypothetical protein